MIDVDRDLQDIDEPLHSFPEYWRTNMFQRPNVIGAEVVFFKRT